MTDDVCGHPTEGGDGPPCQNPAGENGRCHIPSHNDPDAENPQGSRSTFTDEDARIAIMAARKGKSERGIERQVGVSKNTIFGDDGWLYQDHRFTDENGNVVDFFTALMRARSDGEDEWIEEGRGEDGDASFAKFMLATSYDYKKTEKQEVEHSGDGENPVPVTVARDTRVRNNESGE